MLTFDPPLAYTSDTESAETTTTAEVESDQLKTLIEVLGNIETTASVIDGQNDAFLGNWKLFCSQVMAMRYKLKKLEEYAVRMDQEFKKELVNLESWKQFAERQLGLKPEEDRGNIADFVEKRSTQLFSAQEARTNINSFIDNIRKNILRNPLGGGGGQEDYDDEFKTIHKTLGVADEFIWDGTQRDLTLDKAVFSLQRKEGIYQLQYTTKPTKNQWLTVGNVVKMLHPYSDWSTTEKFNGLVKKFLKDNGRNRTKDNGRNRTKDVGTLGQQTYTIDGVDESEKKVLDAFEVGALSASLYGVPNIKKDGEKDDKGGEIEWSYLTFGEQRESETNRSFWTMADILTEPKKNLATNAFVGRVLKRPENRQGTDFDKITFNTTSDTLINFHLSGSWWFNQNSEYIPVVDYGAICGLMYPKMPKRHPHRIRSIVAAMPRQKIDKKGGCMKTNEKKFLCTYTGQTDFFKTGIPDKSTTQTKEKDVPEKYKGEGNEDARKYGMNSEVLLFPVWMYNLNNNLCDTRWPVWGKYFTNCRDNTLIDRDSAKLKCVVRLEKLWRGGSGKDIELFDVSELSKVEDLRAGAAPGWIFRGKSSGGTASRARPASASSRSVVRGSAPAMDTDSTQYKVWQLRENLNLIEDYDAVRKSEVYSSKKCTEKEVEDNKKATHWIQCSMSRTEIPDWFIQCITNLFKDGYASGGCSNVSCPFNPQLVVYCLTQQWKLLSELKKLDDPNEFIGQVPTKNKIATMLLTFMENPTVAQDHLNMILMGPAGTGKTDMAKRIGSIYACSGLLLRGDFSGPKTQGDLCGQYIGETAPKTRGLLNSYYEGVLFIDEAYSLGWDVKGTESKNEYGAEAIATLIAFLTDNKGCICVIAAGYEEDIKSKFLAVNEGLNRRFPFQQVLIPYSTEECWKLLTQVFLPKNFIVFGEDKVEAFTKKKNSQPWAVLKEEGASVEFKRILESMWADQAPKGHSRLNRPQSPMSGMSGSSTLSVDTKAESGKDLLLQNEAGDIENLAAAMRDVLALEIRSLQKKVEKGGIFKFQFTPDIIQQSFKSFAAVSKSITLLRF